MLRLIATIGLPGSGKTSWAKKERASDSSLVLIDKDGLRLVLHDNEWNPENEKITERVHNVLVERILFGGRSVICHNTHLAPRHLEELAKIAEGCGASFHIKSFLHVPVETCVWRDGKRKGFYRVGQEVIERMAANQLTNGKFEHLLTWCARYPMEDEDANCANSRVT